MLRPMTSLLQRDLVYVTGKGGVGKSTVAAALGLAAAARGRRTIVCEVASQDHLSRLFRREGVTGRELELVRDLWAVSIDPQAALREWVAAQVGSRGVVRVLTHSSAFHYFAAAAPGARELMTITKAWDLAQPRRWEKGAPTYDLVVVDAPASGHGLGMLRTPRTFADIARVGPIRNQSERVWEFLTDPARTGYLAVAAPAEMPVAETLDLEDRLQRELGRPLEAIVANGVHPRRFSRADLERLAVASTDGRGTSAKPALAAASFEYRRVRAQQAQLGRLRRGARAPVVTLPFLFEPDLDLAALGRLARELGRKL